MKSNVCKLMIATILAIAFNTTSWADYDIKAIEAYNKGIELTQDENYEDALEFFQEAVKLQPDFTDALYNRGIIEEFFGKEKSALHSFKKILKKNPDDHEVLYKIFAIYYNIGKEDKAAEYMAKLPISSPYYIKMARLMETGEEISENTNITDVAEIIIAEEVEKERETRPQKYETEDEVISGFNGPTGMVKDSNGNLFIADYSDDSIYFVDNKGKRKLVAQEGVIDGPMGLAIDKYDNIYVANYEADEIVMIPAKGNRPRILPIEVSKPYAVMVDEKGLLYVSEQGSSQVSIHKLLWSK